ncbi:MAG: sulfatase-like hydrolase/transferase [Candidatus Hydrogenedentes bacterium]|nr:sulfatase-like hydrolase/transferase [Candidatus Hydrogenedentota bacterium]
MKRRTFLRGAAAAGLAPSFSAAAEPGAHARRAAPPGSPNILFIMTDQQRYDCVGANGNPIIRTPHLDRLASESANFSHCFAQSPVCTPSRACFFTGRYAHAHRNRVNYTRLPAGETLFPALLREAGYRTGIVGKSHLYYEYPPTPEEARRTGFDDVQLHDGAQSVDAWSDYTQWRNANDPKADVYYRRTVEDDPALRSALGPGDNPFRAIIDPQYTDTAWTGRRTREQLAAYAQQSGQPFFLFSSYWKPHSPFEVPAPYDALYSDVTIPLPRRESLATIEAMPPHVSRMIRRAELLGRAPEHEMDRERLQWIYRSYYGSITHIDDEVGATLKALDELGLADNTIVVFASDHGDQLLEHGMMGKNVLFEGSVRVPFMIRYPGRVTPGVCDDLVETIDLLPTLFDFCGLETPYHAHGQSLAPRIAGSGGDYTPRECVFSENVMPEVFAGRHNFEKGKGVFGVRHPDAKMVRTRRWKYNYYPPGHEELFDLENDPGEFVNLAGETEHQKIRDELRQRMVDWLISATETDQIAEKWLV